MINESFSRLPLYPSNASPSRDFQSSVHLATGSDEGISPCPYCYNSCDLQVGSRVADRHHHLRLHTLKIQKISPGFGTGNHDRDIMGWRIGGENRVP